MAKLKPALTEEQVKKTGVADLRKEYTNLARDYTRLTEGGLYYCHKCGNYYAQDAFYTDKKYASGLYPICKKCTLDEACDYDKSTKMYVDNREKTIEVFRKMDLPFIDSLYNSVMNKINDDVAEKTRQLAFSYVIVCVKSLPQYQGLTFKNSEFDIQYDDEKQINENSRILKQAKKRFGEGYTNTDLMYLENEYQDWIKRYPCENKAQEVLYENICRTQLNIDKKQKQAKDTKDDLKTLQDLMTSLQIKPSQTNSNALTEAKTFGQLIEKWEDEYDGGKPIPEPDEDFKDPDKIGLLIDVFFKGHLAKMMGLKNGFSRLYEKYISKYTVKQQRYDEDSDSEAIFEQLFGKEDEI